jgi:hypothetical protein
MESPKLIEPGVKYYINNTLQKCQYMKETFNYYIYNFYYLAILLLLLGGFLLFKYKGKLTPIEIKAKKNEEKKIIYTNLMKINKIKHNMDSENMLTGLPVWNTNNYDNLNTNKTNPNIHNPISFSPFNNKNFK